MPERVRRRPVVAICPFLPSRRSLRGLWRRRRSFPFEMPHCQSKPWPWQTTVNLRSGTRGPCAYQQRRQSFEFFAEGAEHLCAIGVDFYFGGRGTVSSQRAVSGFEGRGWSRRLESGSKVTLKDLLHVAGW